MNDVTLKQLRYLVSVAETGSLAAAADQLFVSQTAVSLALTQLEAALGVQLAIRRKSKGSALTPAGATVATRARGILREASELGSVAGELQGQLSGTLRVGCYRAYSSRIIPEMVQYFAENHPNVDLFFDEGSSTELQAQMVDGTLDACFILRGHVLSHSSFEPIAAVIPKVLLSAHHPLASQGTVSFKDLAGLPAVLSDVKPAGTLVEAMIRSMGFQPDVRWRSSSTETIRSMVGRGLAYSVLLSIWPGPTSQEGLPLVLKNIAEPVPENAFGLAYPAGLGPTRKIDELLAFGRENFSAF